MTTHWGWEKWEDRSCLSPSQDSVEGEQPVNTTLFLKYQGLLSMETQMLVEKIDGPLSCRAFARCLAFTPSRWSCFTLYRRLNIHWARERKTRDWFYCPVVWVLTWDVRDARSSPCSKDDLIIYTKWEGSSKEATLFFSTLLTRGLAWHRFSPCYANVSFLHCDLVTSFLFSKHEQELLGGIHTGGSSWREIWPLAHQRFISHQRQGLVFC